MQASIFGACGSQDKLGGMRQEGHPASKWGPLRDEGGGSLISPDGVVPSQTVSVSVSDISPCTINHHTTTILVLRPFFRLLLGLVW